LKPDVTAARAALDMTTIASKLAQEYPENEGGGVKVVSLHKQVVGEIRPALMVLLGAVGFVLLIACANVANLLLARAIGRQKEMALRAALGATRGRLVRQLLTESVLLAVLGGVLGTLLAQGLTRFFSLLPYTTSSYFVPYNVSSKQMGLDGQVLIFTLIIILVTGLVFGLAPALQTSKLNQYEALKEGGNRTTSGSHHRSIRSLLVISEVALSLMLLIGAGLMIKSFLRLQDVDPGFNPNNVLTMEISLPRARYSQDAPVLSFYKQALERIRGMVGVQAAGLTNTLPLNKAAEATSFLVEGEPMPTPGQMPTAYPRTITPDYFSAMGIRLRAGREFTDRDNAEAPRVAIINETLARRYWPTKSPVGKRLALTTEVFKNGQLDLASGWREIVGIAADVRAFGLDEQPRPEAYVPFMQRPSRDMTPVIRASSDPERLTSAIRGEMLAIDKDQVVTNVKTMTQLLNDSVTRPRSNFLLLLVFAVVALALAVAGVYGVMSYSVAQRMREFGIRIALGAGSADLIKLVLKEGLSLAGVGVVIGLAGAWGLTRFLSSLLFGVSATDPTIFAAISLLLIVVALLACYIPARKATKVDPMVVLRSE